ncbi:MAG: DUF433 domain-containing protein [Cyanobacteria bacterium J06635_15]
MHHGTPTIAGTRVPVSLVIGSWTGGICKTEVMQEHELTQIQVQVALAYAVGLVKATQVTALGA